MHIIAGEQKWKINDGVSKGTSQWIRIHRHKNAEDAISSLKSLGYGILVSDLSETSVSMKTVVSESSTNQRLALVFGNESSGVSEFMKKNSDARFVLPMVGMAQVTFLAAF